MLASPTESCIQLVQLIQFRLLCGGSGLLFHVARLAEELGLQQHSARQIKLPYWILLMREGGCM